MTSGRPSISSTRGAGGTNAIARHQDSGLRSRISLRELCVGRHRRKIRCLLTWCGQPSTQRPAVAFRGGSVYPCLLFTQLQTFTNLNAWSLILNETLSNASCPTMFSALRASKFSPLVSATRVQCTGLLIVFANLTTCL
jgi:hypothetical protein